jgi:hypothetical protein
MLPRCPCARRAHPVDARTRLGAEPPGDEGLHPRGPRRSGDGEEPERAEKRGLNPRGCALVGAPLEKPEDHFSSIKLGVHSSSPTSSL